MRTDGLVPALVLAAGLLAALTLLPGVLLKVIAVLRRRPSPAILGPLFWHELVTVTRRGTQVRLRTAYALILLGGLLVAFLSQFSDINPIRLLLHGGEFPRERVTTFATTYFQIFLFCQLAALTLVMPVFAGGSIIEEKNRGTLDFLQTSRLSNREIVIGKLAARVVFVLGLALVGLPVLALTLLFGGVDPEILALSFATATLSTISLAAFSLWQATRHATLKIVLVNAYGMVFALFVLAGCCAMCTDWMPAVAVSPFSLLLASENPVALRRFDISDATMVCLGIHGVLAFVFSVLAMGNIRAIMIRQPIPSGPPAKWIPAVDSPARDRTPREVPEWSAIIVERHRRERPPPRYVRVPPVDDERPFFWKELYFGGKLPSFEADALRGCGMALLVATVLPAMFGLLVASVSHDRPQEVINPFFQKATVVLFACIAPLAGMRAVGCVAQERQRQTLDSLFAIPEDRRVFLEAKAWVAFQWLRYWVLGYGFLAVVAVLSLSVGPGPFALTGLALVAATVLPVAFAVWLSVRCAEPARAMAWYLTGITALILVPPMLAVLVGGVAEMLGASPRFFAAVAEAFSLPFGAHATNALAGPRRNFEDWSGAVAGTLAAAAVWISMAVVLWRDALRRFELEGR